VVSRQLTVSATSRNHEIAERERVRERERERERERVVLI
jgi:hypothetical protein